MNFTIALFKKLLKDNDTEMYSTHNEGKSLKNKIYEHMTLISKNLYIDKLDDIVNKYKNTYHWTIKMKPIDVKDNTYFDSIKEVNYKDPKFKFNDNVRISKYKSIFAKGYTPNWSEEFLWWAKLKRQSHGHMLWMISIVKRWKRTTKRNQQKFRIEKFIKKGNKLYMSNRSYDNSFNSWIDKKT